MISTWLFSFTSFLSDDQATAFTHLTIVNGKSQVNNLIGAIKALRDDNCCRAKFFLPPAYGFIEMQLIVVEGFVKLGALGRNINELSRSVKTLTVFINDFVWISWHQLCFKLVDKLSVSARPTVINTLWKVSRQVDRDEVR